MDATLANTTTASGRWLGAYGSGAAADYTMAASAISTAVVTASDSKGSQAKLLNWLVSGNENTSFSPATQVGASGNITTPPTQFQFTPNGAVAGLSASVNAATDTITVADRTSAAKPARLLVGPNTVGNSIADYVVAPVREITAEAPGMGTTPVPVGRYAWWVGDEGAKARMNLPLAGTNPLLSASGNAAQKQNAFVSAQRPAVELVDAIHPSATVTRNTVDMLDPANAASRYNPADPLLPKLLAPDQIPMTSAANANALRTAIRYRHHDLTVSSASVLSDSYAGGLKKDLSALLATGAASPADTEFIVPPDPNTSTPPADYATTSPPYNWNHLGMPTWGQMRSFAQTVSTSAGILPQVPAMATNPAHMTAPVGVSVGINPVMTYMAVGFRFIAPEGDAVGNRIRLAMVPIVVLWNPYTSTMRGTDNSGSPIRYEVGFRKAFASKFQLQGRPASSGAVGSYTWSSTDTVLENIDFGRTNTNPYYRFIIESPPGGIGPGESLVFTLRTNGADYNETNVLHPGFNDNYYVLHPGTATIPTALGAGAYYRVGANASPNSTNPNAPRTVNSVSVPATLWNYGSTDGNWGGAGNGWQEAYLGDVTTGTSYPRGSLPYTGMTSQRLYQSYTLVGTPFVGTPPYGNGSAGYAASSGATGLLQPEATLISDMTLLAPAFRMVMRAQFSNPRNPAGGDPASRSRWMYGDMRALMMLGGGNTYTGQPTQSSWPCDLTVDADDLHVASGINLRAPRNDTALYEFRPDSMPLLNIGMLRHANLWWLGGGSGIGNSNGSGFIQYDYALGSQFPPRLNTASITGTRPERLARFYQNNGNSPGDIVRIYYDSSWLINRALWDRYFVSTIPNAGTGKSGESVNTPIPDILPNPNHIRYGSPSISPAASSPLKNSDRAAAHLLVSGGFNINSTSEQAWRAVLGGNNQLNYDPTDANIGGSAWGKAVFSRFSKPTTNDASSAWNGYKQLSENQIAQFAKNIVDEIRNRGPFISLADFINRRLYTSDASITRKTVPASGSSPAYQYEDTRLKGTIQAAIDNQNLQALMASPPIATNDIINRSDSGPLSLFSSTTPSYKIIQSYNVASIDAFGTGSSTPANPPLPYGTSGAGAPQFLTQADVLTSLGSQLTARSDTFVIRTYGDVLDPVNSGTSPVVLGRAWCEAVVQRVPDYVDDSIPAESNLRTLAPSAAKTTNQNFGRKFKIISFRWLSQSDI
ncbi:MAG: hypothetical protein K0R17_3173 [Rariglobus sp.]|nr:hypothetical protein [Rariglobus sp.]